jgi:exonuclease VII large subunit
VQLQHLQNRAIQNGIYVIRTGQHQLKPLKDQIDTKACYELKKARQMIDHHYQTILSMAVEPTLKRGFALTQDTRGRYITTAEKAYKHNELTITYQDGTVPVEIKHERTK